MPRAPKPLCIGMVTPSFYPILGGLELYVLNISKELGKRGHTVHVFTPERVMGKTLTPREEEIDNVLVHRLPVTLDLSYRARICASLVKQLVANRYGLEIVHTHSHDHLQSLLVLLTSKIRGLPMVVSTYGPIVTQSEYSLKARQLLRLYDGLVTPIMFRSANFVVAKFPFVLPWVRRTLPDTTKTGFSPSGIPRRYLVPARGGYLQQRLKVEGPIILYLGRLSNQKGVHHLIRALPQVLKEVPDAFLAMVGPDYSGFTGKLLGDAENLGVADHVSFLGPVYDQELEMRILASCDVFVMPSSFEGFSQAIHKAWAQGKPVVATRVGSLAEEVESGLDGLLVEYGDQNALAEALVRVLSSPELGVLLGKNGQKKVAKYSYDILAGELEDIYFRVLGFGNALPRK